MTYRPDSLTFTANGQRFEYREADAAHAVKFFREGLQHTLGPKAGQPFILEPWQERIVCELFGWYDAAGLRRYRHAYIEVPRKNGKTTLCAGIALYLLLADEEAGPMVYSAAADRGQAGLVFDEAKRMIHASPILSQVAEIYQHSIAAPRSNGSYKALSAEAYTKHGLNPSGIIFDELHAQPNRELWDVLNTATGSRLQPLTVAITTAGYDRHSICWQQHEYAERVIADPAVDPRFFGCIFAATEDADWKDPKVWRAANPNLGVSLQMEHLEGECAKAQELPEYENTFRRLHLNQWTEQDVRWLSMDLWRENSVEVNHADLLESLKGERCWAGLDLASTQDLTALVLAFPDFSDEDVDRRVRLLAWHWAPEENARRREKRDRVPYRMWAEKGYLKLTPGDVTDYSYIRAKLRELSTDFNIEIVGYDPYNARHLALECIEDGINMVEFPQSIMNFAGPTKLFERLLLARKMEHGHNPLLTWQAGNVTVKRDANDNLRPDKAKSTEKIDGIVASIMAVGLSSTAEQAAAPTISWI